MATNQTIVLDTPEQIAAARILTIRSGLRMEARGLKMSRGRSCLAIARSEGLTKARTAAKALEDLNAYCAEHFNL